MGFDRKISSPHMVWIKTLMGRPSLGVWSGLRTQTRERGTQGAGMLDAITTLRPRGLRGRCVPKARWEPRGSRSGLAEVMRHQSRGGGKYSHPLLFLFSCLLLAPPTGQTQLKPCAEGAPEMQFSGSASLSTKSRLEMLLPVILSEFFSEFYR